MPRRRLPNSLPTVLRCLTTARDRWKLTTVPAERALSAEQWAQLDDANPNSLLSRLIKEASDVDLAQAAQAPIIDDLETKSARLRMFLSHFHQVLDLGIARGFFASGARAYYGRDVDNAVLPPLDSYEDLEDAADKIETGEAARSAAEGATYETMLLPSADEVAAVAAQFRAARNAGALATTKTDTEREQAAALLPQATELAADICDTVEFFYRKDPVPSSRRVKCIRWGVTYIYEPGETPDEPDQPTPPAPTPPGA